MKLGRCALAVAALAGVAGAQAQSFPSKPITMIVPFPAGGGSDILARIVAERMKASLGQPVIIENVGGAGGTIGTARVARSRAGRLHARLRPMELARRQWRALSADVRPAEGPRAGRAAHHGAAVDHRTERSAGEGSRRS